MTDASANDPLQIARSAQRDARQALIFASAAVIFSLAALGLMVLQ